MKHAMTPQKKTAMALVGVVAVMVSLSFIAVPFYSWFCKTTGFAGTPRQAATAGDVILDRTMLIHFDASTDPDLPWTFEPEQRDITLRIGETALAFFKATNNGDHTITGTASYNVLPDQAGGYFIKIECFCFTEQVLQPGETALLPVSFYVDPDIVNDPEATLIKEITLHYTFFESEASDKQAALAPAEAKPVN